MRFLPISGTVLRHIARVSDVVWSAVIEAAAIYSAGDGTSNIVRFEIFQPITDSLPIIILKIIFRRQGPCMQRKKSLTAMLNNEKNK